MFIGQANEQTYGSILSNYLRISVLPEFYTPGKQKLFAVGLSILARQHKIQCKLREKLAESKEHTGNLTQQLRRCNPLQKGLW